MTPEQWLHFIGIFQILDRLVKRPRGAKKTRSNDWVNQRNAESERLAELHNIPHKVFELYEDEAVVAMNNLNKIATKKRDVTIYTEKDADGTLITNVSAFTTFNGSSVTKKEQLPAKWDCKGGSEHLRAQFSAKPEQLYEVPLDSFKPGETVKRGSEGIDNNKTLVRMKVEELETTEKNNGIDFYKCKVKINELTENNFYQFIKGSCDESLFGDIIVLPDTKIVFNAPYDDIQTFYIQIINPGGHRIGWKLKTTNLKRLGVDPPCGVLEPKEVVRIAVSCDSFQFSQEDTNDDRLIIKWTNTPDGATKQFRREWFQGDGMVRRKNLPIEYVN